MTSSSAQETLAHAFDILERDELAAFTRMADDLRGLVISCTVDSERFAVLGTERPSVAPDVPGEAQVMVEAGRRSILDLVDGETDFLSAVMTRRVRLTADVRLMVRLSRAQRAFAEGASRARRMRPLLEAFRASAA
jgi:hypothetical protein